MDDTISRQAAIDAILKKPAWHGSDGSYYHADDIKRAVQELQAAEPEIIRCKDCKYKYVDGDNVKFNLCALNHNKAQSDDWYCADAEREENG